MEIEETVLVVCRSVQMTVAPTPLLKSAMPMRSYGMVRVEQVEPHNGGLGGGQEHTRVRAIALDEALSDAKPHHAAQAAHEGEHDAVNIWA